MVTKVPEHEDSLRVESHRLVDSWYRDQTSGDIRGRKVVYALTSGSISELFRAFDFLVVLPEMNAIHCGIGHVAVDMIQQGEALGLATDICGYVKNDLGLMAGPSAGKGPFGRIPPPDLLVINSGGCFTNIKWFEALGRHFGCPVHMVDVPFVRDGESTEYDRSYVRGQIEELILVSEKLSGRKFDPERLREILSLSKRAMDYWTDLLEYGKQIPSPFDGFFEAVSYMAPMTILRGTQDCVDYYKAAVEEVEGRAGRKESPVGHERFRLLFDGAPPWPRFREFRDMFSRWGGVGVAGTYPSIVWACEDRACEFEDPLDFLTYLASASFINWNLRKRREYIETMATEYQVDGIVVHSVKSCRPFSVGQLDLRNYFARDLGVPTLFLDSDVIDPRYFSSAQIMNRVDTFFETLEQRKAGSDR